MWQAFVQDLRYVIRRLAPNPGFALLVALLIAKVIAADSSMFSSLVTAVLRPHPLPEAGRIAALNYA